MISGITITCFAASYAVCLILEVTRLFFRAPIRIVFMFGFSAAGLVAHSLYLTAQARGELSGGAVAPLSSWHDFCLIAAWVVAAAYLGLLLRRPQNSVGLFLLPLVLALVGLAVVFRDAAPFARQEALVYWRMIHALALLFGTIAVSLGFATGVMYLVQAYRLKHKLPPRQGFRLPSLEWLQRFNAESLTISTISLAIGLISGVALNLLRRSQAGGVSWTDPVVLSSAVLFIWLALVAVFESAYKPARQGKKVAYLTMASFVFLMLALSFVLVGEHAGTRSETSLPMATPIRLAGRSVQGGGP